MRARGNIAISISISLAAACSSPEYDPNCESCRGPGESCGLSFNCPPGNICNLPEEELFDAKQPQAVCTRVVCTTHFDCEAPKICTLERVCRAPICQSDDECAEGTMCIGGGCAPPPAARFAERCAIMTRDRALGPGGSVPLTALAFTTNGRAIPRAEFIWSSSNPEQVTIEGDLALAGARAGSSVLTATVRDQPLVSCTGLSIRTFPALDQTRVRVVAVDELTGGPLSDAQVTLLSEGTVYTASTSAVGEASWLLPGAVESVTVVKAGWQSISVLQPGVRDLFLSAPRAHDLTRAGGLRGRVNLGETKPRDLAAAVVSYARSLDLLELKPVPQVDVLPTLIDAPELEINQRVVPLPGNLVLGLGNKRFTEDAVRCPDRAADPGELGCFVTRMPEGRSAAWVMGGQLRLSQITTLANEISGFMLDQEDEFTSKDRARLLLLVAPLTKSMWFGAAPHVELETHPKIPREFGERVDCTDPQRALLDCSADFTRYQEVDLELMEAPHLTSVIHTPDFPALPRGDCAGAMVLTHYAVLPGRGLVAVGLATAEDVTASDPASCRATGLPSAFGPSAPALPEGQVGLTAAPLHSGMEGSDRILVLAAVDIDRGETRSLDLNLVIERTPRLEREHHLSTRSFLPYPTGALDRARASFTFDAKTPAAAGVRLTLESARGTWVVFAPAQLAGFALPDAAVPRGVASEARLGTLQSFELDSEYSSLWSLTSSQRIDRSIEHLRAVATTQCGRAGVCRLGD